MPKYRHPISDTLYDDDMRKMWEAAKSWQERVLLSLCWLTGARPSEFLHLRRQDVGWTDDAIAFRLPTKKRGNTGDFDTPFRTIILPRPAGNEIYTDASFAYISTVIKRCEELMPEQRLLKFTTRWAEQHITRIGLAALNKPLTPYHFRHTVMTRLAEKGYSTRDIQLFKGAKDLRSVQPYDHSRPSRLKADALHRSRETQV